MTIHIVDELGQPLPNVSVFSSDADGKQDGGFQIIADADGAVTLPAGPFGFVTFRSVGYETRTFQEGVVPSVVDLNLQINDLPAAQITGSATIPAAEPVNWPLIIGIIVLITAIGGFFVFAKNN